MGTYSVVDAAGQIRRVGIKGNTPSATEQQKIQSWLAGENAKIKPVAPVAAEGERTGLFPAIESGFHSAASNLYSAGEGIAGLLPDSVGDDIQSWMKSGMVKEAGHAAEALPNQMTFANIGGAGDALQWLAEGAGTSIPQAVGTGAAIVAGTAVGGPVGGVLAGTAVSAPLFTGSNLQRQDEAGEERNIGKAFVAAIPQALADTIVTRFTFGLGKWGKTVPTKALTSKVSRVLTHVGQSAGAESLTETAQQILERLQAGLPIDDEQAVNEYIESATAGAALGGIFGTLGGGNRERKLNAPVPPPSQLDQLLPQTPPQSAPQSQASANFLTPTTGVGYEGVSGNEQFNPTRDAVDRSVRDWAIVQAAQSPDPTQATAGAAFGNNRLGERPTSLGRLSQYGAIPGRVGSNPLAPPVTPPVTPVTPPPATPPPTPVTPLPPPPVTPKVKEAIKKEVKAEIKKAVPEERPLFEENEYQAAIEFSATAGEVNWKKIKEALRISQKKAIAIRRAMVEDRKDAVEENGTFVVAPRFRKTPVDTAPEPVTKLTVEPVTTQATGTEAAPAFAVVEKQVAPDGAVISSAPIEVVKTQEEAQQIVAAAQAKQSVAKEKPSKPKKTPSKRTVSLLQYIAANGGIKDESGELKAMNLDKHNVPFFGKLVKDTGKSHDYMRESAAQEGYFDHIYGSRDRAVAESTPADLRELIKEESLGNKIFPTRDIAVLEENARAKELSTQADEQAYRESEAGALIDAAVKEYGFTGIDRQAAIAKLMSGDMAPEEAIEATLPSPDQVVEPASGISEAIPGWDDVDLGKIDGVVKQGVIPGTEKVDQKTLDERAAAAALDTKLTEKRIPPPVRQKGVADTALFGDDHKQTSLVDDLEIPTFLRRYSNDAIEETEGVDPSANLDVHDDADRLSRIKFKVAKHTSKYFPPNVRLHLVNYLTGRRTGEFDSASELTPEDKLKSGADPAIDVGGLIQLAVNHIDKSMKDTEIAARLAGVLDHEIVHALRNAGLFTDREWKNLLSYAKNFPEINDFVDKGYEADYKWRDEEYVAELFKRWRGGSIKMAGEPRSLLQRVINFFKKLVGLTTEPEVKRVLENIAEGEFNKRTPNYGVNDGSRYSINSTNNNNTGIPDDTAINSPVLNRANSNPSSHETTNQIGNRVPATPENLAQNIIYTHVNKWLEKRLGGLARKAGVKNFESKVEGFITRAQDKMISAAALIDEVKAKGGVLFDSTDFYMKDELFSSAAGEFIESLQKEGGLYDVAVKAVKASGLAAADTQAASNFHPVAAKFLGSDTYADTIPAKGLIDLYLYAKSAPAKNEYLKNEVVGDSGSGMTTHDANQIRAWFEKHPKFAGIARAEKEIRAVVDATNQFRVNTGLIPPGLVGLEWYMPHRGYLEEDVDPDESGFEAARTGQGYNIRGREDRKPLGRGTLASQILDHVILQNEEAIIRGGKNLNDNAFANMILDNEKMLEGIVDIKRDIPKKRVSVRGQVRIMVDPEYKNQRNVLTFKLTQATADRLNAEMKRENSWKAGDELSLYIHRDRLADAMKGALVNQESQNTLVNAMGKLNKLLTSVNTTYNPAFFLPNFFRDLITASVNIKQFEDIAGLKGLDRALMSNIRKSFATMRSHHRDGVASNPEWEKARAEMAKAGGFTKFYGLRTLEDTVKLTNKELAQNLAGGSAEALKKSKAAFKTLGKFITDYNSTFEDTTRLAVYKTLRDQGVSVERAAQAAKNLTVNFNKGGSSKLLLNSMYLFYNAGIQGTWAIANAGLRSRKVRRMMQGIVAAGVMQDIMMSLLSEEDEDGTLVYDKIPSWQLEHNLVFIDPLGLSDRGYFLIPLPYGFNAFFNAGRATARMARGGAGIGDTVQSVAMATVDAFNPIGGAGNYLNLVAPTVMDPFIDMARNRDFAERPIVPEQNPFGPQKPASQLYWNNTSPLYTEPAKWLSYLSGGLGDIPGNVEVSPEHLQFWTEYMLGGVGSFVRQSFGVGLAGVEGAVTGSWPQVDSSDIPIARRLYGNVSSRNDLERYIENRDRVLSVSSTIKNAIETGDRYTAMTAIKNYQQEYRLSPIVKSLESQRSKISGQIRDIENNPNIPWATKQKIIDQLKERQDQIVGNANKIMASLD
jgi:pyridoxal biosynthesis lyase PdxS